jgi:hypothetical protein
MVSNDRVCGKRNFGNLTGFENLSGFFLTSEYKFHCSAMIRRENAIIIAVPIDCQINHFTSNLTGFGNLSGVKRVIFMNIYSYKMLAKASKSAIVLSKTSQIFSATALSEVVAFSSCNQHKSNLSSSFAICSRLKQRQRPFSPSSAR